MPVYSYKAYNRSGKNITGSKEAENSRALKTSLRKDGIFLIQLSEVEHIQTQKNPTKLFSTKNLIKQRISSQELAVATRQLSTLLSAGITLVEALNALVDQLDNTTFKFIWSDVKQRVNEGAGFAESLSVHSKTFSGLYINMVKAGEYSGALDIVLERLADFTENQANLRSKLMGGYALSYYYDICCMWCYQYIICFCYS